MSGASAGLPADAPMRVLIVDDQALIAEAVRRMLLPHPDIQLVACTKGAEAQAKVAEVKPDLVVLKVEEGRDVRLSFTRDAIAAVLKPAAGEPASESTTA